MSFPTTQSITVAAPLRGRPPTPETALQVAEGHLIGAGAEAIYGRDSLRSARPYDEQADESVRQMRLIGHRLTQHDDPSVKAQGHRIIALAAEYDQHDGQEDARREHGEYRFGMVLVEVKQGCGIVELAETGTQRNRPVRQPTPATQIALVDVEREPDTVQFP